MRTLSLESFYYVLHNSLCTTIYLKNTFSSWKFYINIYIHLFVLKYFLFPLMNAVAYVGHLVNLDVVLYLYK